MILIVALLSFLVSFIVLLATRLYLAGIKLGVGDTFFHLLISKSIRKHRWKYPTSLENVTFVEGQENYHYLAYPPVIHYVMAFFPQKIRQKMAVYLNIVILSIISSLTAVFAYNITSNLIISILSSIIVVFNLSIFEEIVSFTPRPLGVLFYTLVVYIAITSPQNLFSVIALAVLVTLICLTHKFALQVIIFGLIPFALIFDRPFFLLSFALGLLLSVVVSKGFYLKILKEHLTWFQFYYTNPRQVSIIDKLKRVVSRNFWILPIILSVALLFFSNNNILHTDLFAKIAYWAFIPLIIAIIVSPKSLSFLGEEYRYIDYSIFPVGIAFALLIAYSNVLVWLVVAVCLILTFLGLFKVKKYVSRSKLQVEPDDIVSYGSLGNNIGPLYVFPHIRSLEVQYFTNLPVIHPVRPNSNSEEELFEYLITTYGIRNVVRIKAENSEADFSFEALKRVANIKLISTFKNIELFSLSQKKEK